MADPQPALRAIFCEALDRKTPKEQAAYLDEACQGRADLRVRVEALLRANAEASGFLAEPAGSATTTDECTVSVAEGPGTVIGPYKLLEQIGEGGFGVVYMAEQQQPLRRKVALKVLKPGMDTRQVVARFEAERQALALMDHPNIAKILDAGTTEVRGQRSEVRKEAASSLTSDLCPLPSVGRPYFVMELVRGVPITQFCDANRMAPRRRLELFTVVCQAVQHAHQKGIIHRDLKPSNVLVTRHDGKPVVKVIDFGIAKALGQSLTEKTLFTGFAQMIGTPLYMSPEQAEMSGLDVDTRSDIYSLGVLLYELLTGTPPLDEERLRRVGYDELRRLIREEEPPRPSTRISTLGPAAVTVSANRQSDPKQLSRFLRGDLDWIVMKALEKDRSRRYETASALAADVQRYLRHEPVEACPPSTLYRFRKFAERRKGVLMMAAVVVVAVLVAVTGLAVSTTLTLQANKELHEALDRERSTLERERDTLERERQNAYYQRIALAEREWSANDLNRTLQLLDECPPDLCGWEWHYLQRLRLKTLPALRHDSAVFCAVFSPDGERIASASQDGKVTIWDALSGGQLCQFRAHEKHARSVAYSPDGRLLATTSWDHTVKIWDVQTLAQDRNPSPRILTLRGVGMAVMFSPDGKRLASADHYTVRPDGLGRQFAEVKIWDPVSGQELCTLEGQERPTWSAVTFSPDGQYLATGHQEGRGDGIIGNVVHIWDAHTGRKLRTFTGHAQPVYSVAFSPDGRLLASGSGKLPDSIGTDGELKLWDAQTGRELFDVRAHSIVFAVAFSPDGRRLFSAGADQTIKVWDTANGKEVLTLRGHFGTVRTLAFSPNGRQLVSASHDLTVQVWDATPLNGQTDPAYLTLRGHQGDVTSVAFSPDGRYLASGSRDKTIRIWDARTGHQLVPLAGKGGAVDVAFSPDGRRLASTDSKDLNVKLWDASTWKVIRTFPKLQNNGYSDGLAFDGKLLAVPASAEKEEVNVDVWDTDSGHKVHQFRGHTWNIASVVFDRTSEMLASAGSDGTVLIWDVRAGKKLATLHDRHQGNITSVAFSPDGKYLASGSMDRTVTSWSTATWNVVCTIPDAHGGVRCVAFAPDSRRLAWGGTDATVKVADASTGLLIETLHGHTGWVNGVAFSPDGQQIASASADGIVKIWTAPAVPESKAGEIRN
jgi:WD40 repeat protein/serine/threonine protein kinase